MAESFDYIIVGGGSAGCVLANRLSARGGKQVLLLEAGPDYPPGEEPADLLNPFPSSFFNPDYSWPGVAVHWRTAKTSAANPIRIGFGVGGSSSIMGMVALRGTPEDYDEWVELGAAGWGWADVLPYFIKMEADADFGGPLHGKDGPVPIRRPTARDVPPVERALRAYCRNAQIHLVDDFNADFEEGYGLFPFSRFPDKRASAAVCYLTPEVRARPNLTIISRAMVGGLIVEGRRVTGVRASLGGGEARAFTAGEVIVSAGALRSPVMLMRAGIGPAGALRALGIEVVADRAGVGGNLHTHPSQAVAFQTKARARLKSQASATQFSMLRYSSSLAAQGGPAKDMYLTFISVTGWHALGERISALSSAIAKPASRGRISLLPAEGGTRPLVEFNCGADERDRVRLRDSLRQMAGMLLSPELRPLWHAAVPVLGNLRAGKFNTITPWNRARSRAIAALIDLVPATARPILSTLTTNGIDIFKIAEDDAALDEFAQKAVNASAHYVGTCRMGAADDTEAVVDKDGRVYGVEGLRVVDASVMPWVTRGNTNIPTLMIAEKMAAAMLAAG